MSTQSLLTYWKESLEIFFTKGELKLYLLGTLVTFKRALTIIIKKFWWLLLIYLASPHFFFYKEPTLIGNVSLISHKICLLALLFVIITSVRPSLERKDLAYFIRYLPYIWSIYLLYIFPGFFMLPIFTPFIGLVFLFFFDLKNRLQSFGLSIAKTLITTAYFLPALLMIILGIWGIAIILGLTLVPITICLDLLLGMDHFISFLVALCINSLIHFLILLIAYSATCVLYTKLKHKYYNLLFGRTP